MDGWSELRPVLLTYNGQIRSSYRAVLPWYISHMYVNTAHLFAESIISLGNYLPSFCGNSILPNLCVWERSPQSVRVTFGWPLKVSQRNVIGVWSVSKGGQHLPNLCKIRASPHLLLFFPLLSHANWIPALSASPWYCKNHSVSYSSDFGHVMLKVYPSRCMPIFNIDQWYHTARVPLGKTLCDREKPQISLSLNWGVSTIFLLVIVMTIINIYKTPPDIPPAKNRWSLHPLLPVQKTVWKTQLMAKLVQSYK